VKQLVQNLRSGALSVSEVPAPLARPGAVIIATRNSLISAGTERASARTARRGLVGKAVERPDLVRKLIEQVERRGLVDALKMAFNRLDAPSAPGYSAAGVVLEAPGDTHGLRAGERVACAGQNYASHAEIVCVPKNLCVRIPEGVSFEDASYVALGAIALQGIRQADVRLGEVIAVIGLGLLGQLTVQMLLANGCRVIATDPEAGKRTRAAEAGASAPSAQELLQAVAALSGGRGADAVIITASTKDDGPVALAAEIVRKRGRVVVVGAVGMNLPREPYYLKEIDFRLSTSYGPGRYDPEYEEKGVDYPAAYVRWTEQRNMEAFLELVRSGRVTPSALTTHRFPIARAEEAYELILDGSEPYLGVTLEYPGEAAASRERTVMLARQAPAGRVVLGVIGAGAHFTDMLAPHLAARRDLHIRAVCSGSGMKARRGAEKLAAAYCTTDAGAILADDDINAVLIGTRHDSHARLVIQALEAGKHVFVEKPLCLTEEELEAILAAYRRAAHLQLAVGFNRRYSAHAARARSAFTAAHAPLLMSYRVNAGRLDAGHWAQDPHAGGGRLIGEGCHFIDFMQYVTGAVVSSVQAAAARSDEVLVTLDFADGSLGTLLYSAGGDRALPKERFEALGDGRAVLVDDFRTTEVYRDGRRTRLRSARQDKGFREEVGAFCDAVADGAPNSLSLAEIEAVTRACCLAARSLATRERYAVASVAARRA
jgi:predicted dehydrogenase